MRYNIKMIYNVSNDENEIKKLLISLRTEYGDYAFISYIDGEYGIRVWVYNSLVYDFYNKIKSQNKICIGIVFKNTKCFLNNLCDHIIEIDDIEFLSNTLSSKHEDNSFTSLNHVNNIVPCNSYSGNDGWDLTYIRGLYSNSYENILLEMNYKNIFYTLHVDGSRYINLHGCNNGCIYKINDENIFFHNINNHTCINMINICGKESKRPISNKIVVWIRNSNKHPNRNMESNIYNSLFKYCISNNKICCVFQDLTPICLPEDHNIVDMTRRYKNRPDFDFFIKTCIECDIFIGSDSGPLYLLMQQPINIIKFCCHNTFYTDNMIFHTKNMTSALDNFYNNN